LTFKKLNALIFSAPRRTAMSKSCPDNLPYKQLVQGVLASRIPPDITQEQALLLVDDPTFGDELEAAIAKRIGHQCSFECLGPCNGRTLKGHLCQSHIGKLCVVCGQQARKYCCARLDPIPCGCFSMLCHNPACRNIHEASSAHKIQ